MPWKGNAPMPSCNRAHQREIEDAIAALRGAGRAAADELLAELGAEELCRVLHAMRRWYSFNCWNAAKKIIPHRHALTAAMDLEPEDAVGVLRGIHIPLSSKLAQVEAGEQIYLPVERNNGCSSWTLRRKYADRFSGAQPGKIGLVVKLVEPTRVRPFIAPPARSRAWFDSLYRRTMGESYRFNEMEYAIQGNRLRVEVVAVKRR